MVTKTVSKKGGASGGQTEMSKTSAENNAHKPRESEDAQSGELTIPLGTFPAGGTFDSVTFKLSGKAFHGRLKNFSGVTIAESPVGYDTAGAQQSPGNGSQRAFILDFGGLPSLLRLTIDASKANITLLLPWMGTGFADKSVYPPPTDDGWNQFKPKRDPTGKTSVGIPALDTQKLLVQVQPKSGSAFSGDDLNEYLGLTTATFPSNVKAYLEGRLPFWTHPGILNEETEVTGLAED